MLLKPRSSGSSEIKINFGLNTNQKRIKEIRVITIKPKPKPSREINHHFTGLSTWARHANKKITEATIFRTRKIVLVIRR